MKYLTYLRLIIINIEITFIICSYFHINTILLICGEQ